MYAAIQSTMRPYTSVKEGPFGDLSYIVHSFHVRSARLAEKPEHNGGHVVLVRAEEEVERRDLFHTLAAIDSLAAEIVISARVLCSLCKPLTQRSFVLLCSDGAGHNLPDSRSRVWRLVNIPISLDQQPQVYIEKLHNSLRKFNLHEQGR